MNLKDKPNWEILDMAIQAEIPEDYEAVLAACNMRSEYELIRAMGVDHEEAYLLTLMVMDPATWVVQ